MIEVLHAAPGLVHITADVWTAPNDVPLLGTVGHFVNENGWVYHIILGLWEIEGVHTGEILCSVLVQILSEYQVCTNVGYFVLDNATDPPRQRYAVEFVVYDAPVHAYAEDSIRNRPVHRKSP
jgi:hypothetical protein